MPSALADFAAEPAFSWDATTFAYICLPGQDTFTKLLSKSPADSLDDGSVGLLQHVTGNAADYVAYVSEYFECDIELAIVEHVFTLQPVSAGIVERINRERSFKAVMTDLIEIGYPTA